MNKKELITAIGKKVTLISHAHIDLVLSATDSIIKKELAAGGKVQLRNFGIFTTKKRAARISRNPKTGESVNVPAKLAVKFTAAPKLKNVVNGK